MSPEILHSATWRTWDIQWWLTTHLVPGGQGRDTVNSGRKQKDGQGLMNGQDFETKHLSKVQILLSNTLGSKKLVAWNSGMSLARNSDVRMHNQFQSHNPVFHSEPYHSMGNARKKKRRKNQMLHCAQLGVYMKLPYGQWVLKCQG